MPHLIVTRPVGQALRLGELLGARVPQFDLMYLPLLSIVPNIDQRDAKRLKEIVSSVDLAVFVSPNAIECTMRMLADAWPLAVPVAVVGGGSVEALQRHGIDVAHGYTVIAPADPQEWDSEGLWRQIQHYCQDWSGQRILFLKGVGGRAWLGEQFLKAGAELEAIQSYRRVPLDRQAPIWDHVKMINPATALCLMTSSEAVSHFDHVLKESHWGIGWHEQISLLCSHPRIEETAISLGFKKVEICLPGDDNLVQASQAWLAGRER